MARVPLVKPETVTDPIIQEIFDKVIDWEGKVPNHFYVEMNFPEYFKMKLGSSNVLWSEGEMSMEEIQHIGILVSKANGCDYCTGAFCTILNHGLDTPEAYIEELLASGTDSIKDKRLLCLVNFALKVNVNPKAVSDDDIEELKSHGLSAKGVVQIIHVVSDFGSYNRLNLALQTDYDYQDLWRKK